jgi:hypothetical protein
MITPDYRSYEEETVRVSWRRRYLWFVPLVAGIYYVLCLIIWSIASGAMDDSGNLDPITDSALTIVNFPVWIIFGQYSSWSYLHVQAAIASPFVGFFAVAL